MSRSPPHQTRMLEVPRCSSRDFGCALECLGQSSRERTGLMTRPLATLAITMLAAFGALHAQAQACSNSILNGTYIYQLGGAVAAIGGTVSYVELGKLVAN